MICKTVFYALQRIQVTMINRGYGCSLSALKEDWCISIYIKSGVTFTLTSKDKSALQQLQILHKERDRIFNEYSKRI